MARLVGDQLEQHELQFAGIEDPPAAAAAMGRHGAAVRPPRIAAEMAPEAVPAGSAKFEFIVFDHMHMAVLISMVFVMFVV